MSMLKKFLFLFQLLLISTVNAYSTESTKISKLPAEVIKITDSYVTNYCYALGSQAVLENYKIQSFTIKPITGYADSVKKIEVNIDLEYGNDDFRYEENQILVLENTSGVFEITSASGPCLTLIKY